MGDEHLTEMDRIVQDFVETMTFHFDDPELEQMVMEGGYEDDEEEDA